MVQSYKLEKVPNGYLLSMNPLKMILIRPRVCLGMHWNFAHFAKSAFWDCM